VTRWRGSGTHKAPLAGNPPIPATGKAVSVSGVWIHKIAGGKIVQSWNAWDMLGMLRQLGVVPQPGSR
jgi:predicted ester cyclase